MITMLYVDDEPLATKYFCLEYADYFDIRVANSADEALEIIKYSPSFDVVLSDYIMPMKTGLELLRNVKEISGKSKRVIYTSHIKDILSEHTQREGIIHKVISKPAEIDDLINEINNLFL